MFYFQTMFLQALGSIDSFNITSGVVGIAGTILLLSFLYSAYQAFAIGGDVRALAISGAKYLALGLVFAAYGTVFRDVNSAFNSVAMSISNSVGAGDLFSNWMTQLGQYWSQNGNPSLWSLVGGGISGLLDALLIIVAYLIFPITYAVFALFYSLYGSILYVTGPLVRARVARSALIGYQGKQAPALLRVQRSAIIAQAGYVGVVAGGTRRFLDCDDKKFGALERDKNVVADLPANYGKPPEYKYRKGVSNEWQDIKPVSKGELISAIKKCHQTLWGGGRRSPPAAFGEFCKIIFVKVRDEKAPRKKGDPYKFQIKTDEPAYALAARIKTMYGEEMKREPDVFREPIKVDEGTLKMCVSHLEAINFNKTDLDTKGVAFEQFLDGFFKGDFGQYFTPREIIQFAVEMLKPSADDCVLDPACGSGGFLLYAMDYVRHEAEKLYDEDDEAARFRHWHDFARDRLFGIEINDEISRVAKMNMILHDDGHTNIVGFDALERFDRLKDQKRRLAPDSFDLVLTNPPFGAMVKEAEKGKAYMEGWDLLRYIGKGEQPEGSAGEMASDFKAGKKSIKARTSVKTEILFCERVWHFLKPGTGRAAIVLPDGILTNSSLQGVRDWLMERFQLMAVISLPQAAFQHSGAGVKASVVFVRKRAANEGPDDNEAIFMAAPANIGYDATGRKTARVTIKSENGKRKVEVHATDLFETEMTFEKAPTPGTGIEDWQERSRRVLGSTGVLGQYRAFERKPEPFFV